MRWAALALPIITHFVWKALTVSQQSTGTGKCHSTGNGSEVLNGLLQLPFRFFMGLVEGKRREGEIWMWSNKRFLTKRFELSVEIIKRIVHIFLMRPNWKNRFWKNAFDELNPLPWVLQSTRKAQSPLEPVTKSNTSTWKIEFGRTQTLSFKPGHSKVVWPQAESWSDDRWVHSVTLLWITSFFFICFPAVSTARKK